ncbi:DUF2851 family protein [Tenacibaculum halocynthiae]|uniref:DUF2851 family protein n=1 Tax=Tenacibaculum halocynthiae TaxID=1254437 RepID=UPI003893AEA1
MKEDFLHYVWLHMLFSTHKITTTNSESLNVIKVGMPNTNSGPDFLNAQLQINAQTWVGNVEIHVKSSDWYLHQHESDENYDAVILHVVWEHDSEVFMKNNKPLPTLELCNYVDKNLSDNFLNLVSKSLKWIPCQKQISTVDSFLLKNWMERLYFERLEAKSILVNQLLEESNNDYEAVLFKLLAKNFGLKVNGEVFFKLARSFDYSILRKTCFDEYILTSLLFGQAGFLEEDIQNKYFLGLKNEYEYLKHKYQLKSLKKNQFQFFRMRPANFPTIRFAQLVALMHTHQNLFSKLMKCKKLNEFYDLFLVEINNFWKEHYTFETTSKKSSKRLTKSFIDLLIINTVIPLKFVFFKGRGGVNEDDILNLIKELKPEKNSVISKFSELKITSENAFETQSLLELKNNYCEKYRCLECAIGNDLLRNNDIL